VLQVPMADRIKELLQQQQPRDIVTEHAERIALQALGAASAIAADQKASQNAANASNATGATAVNPTQITQNGATSSVQVPATNRPDVRMPVGMHSKALPLEPEFEHMLSMRVAAVMHRGLQLACGLGGLRDAQPEAIEGDNPKAPITAAARGANNVVEASAREAAHAWNDQERRLATSGTGVLNGAVGSSRQTNMDMPIVQPAKHGLGSLHGQDASAGVQTWGTHPSSAREPERAQPDVSNAEPTHMQGQAASPTERLGDGVAAVRCTVETAAAIAGREHALSVLASSEATQGMIDAHVAVQSDGVTDGSGVQSLAARTNGIGPNIAANQHPSVPACVVSDVQGVAAARIDAVGVDGSVAQQSADGGLDGAAGDDDDSDAIPEIDSGPSEEDEEEMVE
jgi:hypothetical protein